MTGPTLTSPFKNTSELSKGGRKFTYVPAAEVVDRLNACLGYGGWSFECEVTHIDADFVAVKGRLSALGQVYEQFGGQSINKNREGKTLDLGDDLKGSSSDALKKCAAMIGVGLYLSLGRSPYHPSGVVTAGSGGRAEAPTPAPPATSEEEAVTPSASDGGGGPHPPPPPPRPTAPALSAKCSPRPQQRGRRTTHDGRTPQTNPVTRSHQLVRRTPEKAGAPMDR